MATTGKMTPSGGNVFEADRRILQNVVVVISHIEIEALPWRERSRESIVAVVSNVVDQGDVIVVLYDVY